MGLRRLVRVASRLSLFQAVRPAFRVGQPAILTIAVEETLVGDGVEEESRGGVVNQPAQPAVGRLPRQATSAKVQTGRAVGNPIRLREAAKRPRPMPRLVVAASARVAVA